MNADRKPIPGLHHVTAIVADAQRTLDFYTQVLGLRLVKRTVNFDDPGSYHLYFGDDAGSPGTILTFFAWPGAARGTLGTGETQAVAFSIPAGSLDFWAEHLAAAGISVERQTSHLASAGEQVLRFADPDGMQLELVAHEEVATAYPARTSNVPPRHAIHGFFGVTLGVAAIGATEQVLLAMGFTRVREKGDGARFAATAESNGPALGSRIDLVLLPAALHGRMGAGTVHHIAFRNADDATQCDWQAHLGELGLQVTPVMDRTYFHSVYFREPGGLLFELATDPPGFTFDEPVESLGEALKLPEWLEPQRTAIEKRLPPLVLRTAEAVSR